MILPNQITSLPYPQMILFCQNMTQAYYAEHRIELETVFPELLENLVSFRQIGITGTHEAVHNLGKLNQFKCTELRRIKDTNGFGDGFFRFFKNDEPNTKQQFLNVLEPFDLLEMMDRTYHPFWTSFEAEDLLLQMPRIVDFIASRQCNPYHISLLQSILDKGLHGDLSREQSESVSYILTLHTELFLRKPPNDFVDYREFIIRQVETYIDRNELEKRVDVMNALGLCGFQYWHNGGVQLNDSTIESNIEF